jgi:hypothetical protein
MYGLAPLLFVHEGPGSCPSILYQALYLRLVRTGTSKDWAATDLGVMIHFHLSISILPVHHSQPATLLFQHLFTGAGWVAMRSPLEKQNAEVSSRHINSMPALWFSSVRSSHSGIPDFIIS